MENLTWDFMNCAIGMTKRRKEKELGIHVLMEIL